MHKLTIPESLVDDLVDSMKKLQEARDDQVFIVEDDGDVIMRSIDAAAVSVGELVIKDDGEVTIELDEDDELGVAGDLESFTDAIDNVRHDDGVVIEIKQTEFIAKCNADGRSRLATRLYDMDTELNRSITDNNNDHFAKEGFEGVIQKLDTKLVVGRSALLDAIKTVRTWSEAVIDITLTDDGELDLEQDEKRTDARAVVPSDAIDDCYAAASTTTTRLKPKVLKQHIGKLTDDLTMRFDEDMPLYIKQATDDLSLMFMIAPVMKESDAI